MVDKGMYGLGVHFMSARVHIRLSGRLRVAADDGSSLLPKSVKAQAIIALLASSRDMERGRRWIQDKLWSDRAREQGAGSLRQALHEIRKAFGQHAPVLIAGRDSIRLDAHRVKVEPLDASREFLEGIDVNDSEFEFWLSEKRVTNPRCGSALEPLLQDCTSASQYQSIKLTVAFRGSDAANESQTWAEQLFIDCVARTLREAFSAEVLVGPVCDLPVGALLVRVACSPVSGVATGLRLCLEDPTTGRQIWSGFRCVPGKSMPSTDDPELLQLANLLIEEIGEWLGGANLSQVRADDPNQLCRRALRKMMTIRRDQVHEADTLLKRAYDLDPQGIYLAWRGQCETIKFAEKFNEDPSAGIERAREFCSRAIEAVPLNSMVLAISASTRLFTERDPTYSIDLAKRAVKLNPANPMGWWAMGSSRLYAGDVERSYKILSLARKMTLLSPNGFWWDNHLAAAALLHGKIDEATRLFESSSAGCSDFRPPLRYRAAIYANAGQEERALETARKLQELEPDFTLDQLAHDRAYPASLLWRAEVLDMGKVAALR